MSNDEWIKTSEKTMNEKLGLRSRGTQDIIEAAYAGNLPDKIMITVHPQRWSDSFFPWFRELVFQNVKNVIKKAVVLRSMRLLELWKGKLELVRSKRLFKIARL